MTKKIQPSNDDRRDLLLPVGMTRVEHEGEELRVVLYKGTLDGHTYYLAVVRPDLGEWGASGEGGTTKAAVRDLRRRLREDVAA